MPSELSRGLAFAFLAGPWTAPEMIARGREALGGERAPWLRLLARESIARFPSPPLGREDELADILRRDPALRQARSAAGYPRIRRWLIPEAAMARVEGPPAGFLVAPIPALGDLARLLELGDGELDWFVDHKGMNAKADADALSHYRYEWVAKARGGHRLLEAPKSRLKRIQRWILREVLAAIPASPVAHGFVRGRDVRSFVEPHVGRAVVARLDLEDFFASITRARVAAIFRRVGYPRPVAAALAGLCTAVAPVRVLAAHPRAGADLSQRFLTNQRLRDPHLPQGAPTSPALSNLAAWRLDRRLGALAAVFDATMTRYADDIAFAGDARFGRSLAAFLPRAAAVALEEGFRVNHRKTRVMPRGGRQELCGLVVNQRPNLRRQERDNLRALLFNAARLGPDSQNRGGHTDFRRHVEGRIAWARSINPAFGARLAALFARISWGA